MHFSKKPYFYTSERVFALLLSANEVDVLIFFIKKGINGRNFNV